MNTATIPQAPAVAPVAASALYRRVWRWHFYAGLICLPFLALLATTGALYLFKEPIESLLYAPLLHVPAQATPGLDAQTLLSRALAAEPGQALRFVAPAAPGRSAEVGVRTKGGAVAVYLDPVDGRVLGTLRDDRRLSDIVRRFHSLAIAGPLANLWVEVMAGWAIALVASGVFLWWPRGRSGGVHSMRAHPARRVWWRDLHAVTGAAAAVAIVFLAVTGMPWSAFWGEQFARWVSAAGLGVPSRMWNAPPSQPPPSQPDAPGLPWALREVPVPLSQPPDTHDAHDQVHTHGHAHANAHPPAPTPPTATTPVLTPATQGAIPVGLNGALRVFARLGLPAGVPVSLPDGPQGVYTAMHLPDDVRAARVVHLDRYSGAVLTDIGYADYGVVGRATEWGISIHTGRQFGLANQLLMLAGCLAIVVLAASAVVMWLKRRPQGRLGAPPCHADDHAATGAIAVAVLLGLIYPLLGASMLVALVVDAAVPTAWRQRLGL